MDYLRALNFQDGKEATYALFKLWTLKEAYTKALGHGLGFDMTKIEYDFAVNMLQVDDLPLTHWRVRSFHFITDDKSMDEYVGTVCYGLDANDEESGGFVVSEELKSVNMDIKVLVARMEQLMLYSEILNRSICHRLDLPRGIATRLKHTLGLSHFGQLAFITNHS